MKCATYVLGFVLLAGMLAIAQTKPVPPAMVQDQFVYVTTYDGPLLSNQVPPEEEQAAGNVQAALMKWNLYAIVNRRGQADLILMVMKRPTEDALWVYDARQGTDSPPLWYASQRGGLSGSMPLLQELHQQVSRAREAQGARR